MWKRRSGWWALEAALRSLRAEARPDLVQGITDRIQAQPTRGRRPWSRLAFAAAVSVFILGSFASFGGLSYAAPGVGGTVAAVKQVVALHPLKVTVHKSSAMSQYPAPPTKPKNTFKPPAPPKPKAAAATKTPPVASGQTLPFTGMSLLGTLVASVFLVSVGLVLRRRERRN